MLKWLMLILIFLICAGCGVIYTLDLAARRRQIQQMQDLIRYLRREIRCSYATLPRILSEYKQSFDFPLLREMALSEPFDLIDSYEKSKRSCKGEMFFCEEEWAVLDRLFYALGHGDLMAQENCLDLADTSFGEAEKNAKTALEKKGKSAMVLGCCTGAVLVLMLL